MKWLCQAFCLLLVFVSIDALAEKNQTLSSFDKAKGLLLKSVYSDLPRRTIYCSALFDERGVIMDHAGFVALQYLNRYKKIEWEHIVPAENFGRGFVEWREGHPECVDSKGQAFKGRNCANKVSQAFRYMYADMYNLYPAIGSVNAMRSNYNFAQINKPELALQGCAMQIDKAQRRAEPPDAAKGVVARVYLYFDQVYPHYSLSDQQRKLFTAWDKLYPVRADECRRAQLIEKLQFNRNTVLFERCVDMQ